MSDPESAAGAAGSGAAPGAAAGTAGRFEVQEVRPPVGLVRRFLTTLRHLAALLFGGLNAHVRAGRKDGAPRAPWYPLVWVLAVLSRPFLNRSVARLPFPVQFRRRLEMLGPTYIKLGQILSLREDLLPRPVADELKGLLDHLPAVPFEPLAAQVERELGRPLDEMFRTVERTPLGSASIAQVHRAETHGGDRVILKVVKPGIRETLARDTRLLRMFGSLLDAFAGRYQPRRIVDEFCDYTLKEADLRLEADNAETFAANFRDMPDVHFPKVYREFSSRSVLCLEYVDGIRPDSPEARTMSEADRKRLVDLGAEAIIRMVYRDGFFHADLHPGNLRILPGPRVGFIDLGMVGQFDNELRRTLLYYYYCLVVGDFDNAARYLSLVARPGPGADVEAFRREVAEMGRRWRRASDFEHFSLARLVLVSLTLGGRYRMYFPVEMVLMVKALITYEGVGYILMPSVDIAAVSREHVRKIFIAQFHPLRLIRESLRGAPEMVDALVKAPLLITEGLRVLEQTTRRPPENPFAGLRGTLLAGFCLVAGAVLAALGGPWPLWALLFLLALLLSLKP